jgi:hypothetical protein
MSPTAAGAPQRNTTSLCDGSEGSMLDPPKTARSSRPLFLQSVAATTSSSSDRARSPDRSRSSTRVRSGRARS